MHVKYSKDQIVMHMPHCSTIIPDYSGYSVSKELIHEEIIKSTDWGVDEIFAIPGIEKVRFGYSRVFCDVERFYDDGEPLAKIGFGIVYTSLSNGETMRELSNEDKNSIISNYYDVHHNAFTKKVQEKLDAYGEVLIIDCHSFPKIPLMWEEHKDLLRPQICIGTDSFHTPIELSEYYIEYFKTKGYSVAENQPFLGTIVPTKFYYKDPRVKSIMIEVNRGLFMGETSTVIDESSTSKLNEEIENLVTFSHQS